jgi:hypothetical protein
MKSGKCQRGNLKWNIEEGQLIENGQKDIQRVQEKFEDTKLVFISRKSKSDRQHNDQKKKNKG